MQTISKITLKFIVIKSIFFTFSKRKKERDYKIIEKLAFNSEFEEDIFTILKNKWIDKSWILKASVIFLGIPYKNIIEILKQILSQ